MEQVVQKTAVSIIHMLWNFSKQVLVQQKLSFGQFDAECFPDSATPQAEFGYVRSNFLSPDDIFTKTEAVKNLVSMEFKTS